MSCRYHERTGHCYRTSRVGLVKILKTAAVEFSLNSMFRKQLELKIQSRNLKAGKFYVLETARCEDLKAGKFYVLETAQVKNTVKKSESR